ncbi:MAG: PQQ-dependent sugar dehydrogenase [Pseudomonadota bacterium]
MIRTMIALIALGLPASAQVAQGPKNVPEFEPAFENQTRAAEISEPQAFRVTPVAEGLVHPWGLAILPDGEYLVTERIGRLTHVSADGTVTRVDGLPSIAVFGQGGLLDVAVADDFATSRRLYLTMAREIGRGQGTAAVTAVLSDDNRELNDVADIFEQRPAANSGAHFGSRIVLDGDYAFITIGDRGSPDNSQDLQATIGKVVRVTLDGDIPESNPFANNPNALNDIWTYGHRNPQGAALHPDTGELWTLEHGPRGGDELNRIIKGANYGWPVISYGENYNGRPVKGGQTQAEGMEQPRYYWDPVIAPGDFTFYQGDLFEGWAGDVLAASLNPGGLVRLTLDGDRVTGEARYLRELGRVRDVDVDTDGSLLVLTDDPDGGLLRITPRN